MDVINLPRKIYEKAVKLEIKSIRLSFTGGNDEGFLDVSLKGKKGFVENQEFESEINDWAFDAYDYSGAGDGSEYGDEIEYDLENNKVTTSSWHTETKRVSEGDFENELEVDYSEDDL